MNRIFISRDLSKNSKFFELENEGYTIIDKSLIQIEPIPFGTNIKTDWIFFYSKNGIEYFFREASYNPLIKYAVIGKASGNYFKNLTDEQADFIGNGTTAQIADSLKTNCRKSSILFVKANNSLNSIENLLADDVNIMSESLVVYKNQKLENFSIDPCDILIFTSPLNAEAYFDKYNFNSQLILSIGSTTAKKISDLCGQESLYPDSPTENELFDLLKSKISA